MFKSRFASDSVRQLFLGIAVLCQLRAVSFGGIEEVRVWDYDGQGHRSQTQSSRIRIVRTDENLPNIHEGRFEDSNNRVVLIEEGQDVVVTRKVDVDIPKTPIAAGDAVDSFLLHFDPLNDTLTSQSNLVLEFRDRPILGVIYSDTRLDNTDYLGRMKTLYPTNARGRGATDGDSIDPFHDYYFVENEPGCPSNICTRNSPYVMHFSLSENHLDQIRVLTPATADPAMYLETFTRSYLPFPSDTLTRHDSSEASSKNALLLSEPTRVELGGLPRFPSYVEFDSKARSRYVAGATASVELSAKANVYMNVTSADQEGTGFTQVTSSLGRVTWEAESGRDTIAVKLALRTGTGGTLDASASEPRFALDFREAEATVSVSIAAYNDNPVTPHAQLEGLLAKWDASAEFNSISVADINGNVTTTTTPLGLPKGAWVIDDVSRRFDLVNLAPGGMNYFEITPGEDFTIEAMLKVSASSLPIPRSFTEFDNFSRAEADFSNTLSYELVALDPNTLEPLNDVTFRAVNFYGVPEPPAFTLAVVLVAAFPLLSWRKPIPLPHVE